MSAPKRTWSGTVPQILIGVILAGLIVAVIEANSDYDQDCGWSFLGTHVSHWGSGDHHKIRIGKGRCRVDVELDGDVDFTADNRGVARLGPGAKLSITDRRRGERRRLEVERGRDGKPVYEWWVNRARRDFDDAGRDWLADTLPRIYRSTGLDADGRVEALWAAGGFDAVMAELREIPNNNVRATYLREVLARCSTDGEIVAALDFGRREISSDHEMGRVLGAFAPADLTSSEVRDAWVAALRTIDSDWQLRHTLTQLLKQPEFDPAMLGAVLEAARSISSDHEQAELLIEVARLHPADVALPAGYVDALATVGSDHDHRRVLEAALVRRTPSEAEAEMLLATADDISSDSTLADLLAEFARVYPRQRALPPSFFIAADTIESDHALGQLLSIVVDDRDLDAKLAAQVLDLARTISSDHELTSFLDGFLAEYPAHLELPPEFEEVVATIDSSHERETIEQALARSRAEEGEGSR